MLRARLAILAAAVLWSTGGAAIKLVSLDGWQVASGRGLVAALALGLAMPGARRWPSRRALGAAAAYAAVMVLFVLATKLTFLGAVQIGLSYVLFSRGVRHTPAVEASLLVLVEPVLNPIWALLLVGERPGPWSIAGGAVILGATAWRTVLAARAAPPQAPLPGARA
ncbi:EamA family transporter [Sorangium sp. So ce1024]|uniref:EamA family transporter n=1 Tax=unclassified Sorangium TaxID=2621164 RepID=UPI003F014BFE